MAAETKDLRIDVQEPASWSRRLLITVPGERVQRTRKSVASQFAGKVRLPGFRQGKTPTSMIEKQFAGQIEQETVDRLIQEAYREALEGGEFNPITQGQVEKVEYEPGSDLTFEVHFEVAPKVEIGTVSGFTVERTDVQVGEEEVDAVLERVRTERSVLHPVEDESNPDYGDQVTVEMTDLDAAEEEGAEEETEEDRTYRFVLGEGQAIPDIEEAIRTLTVGQDNEFTVRFPEDFPDPEQAGVEQRLRIRLASLSRREMPELDDDFAKSLGDFEDMAALRARILEDLRTDAERRTEADLRAQLVKQVVDANPFDVPDSMVQRWIDFSSGLVDNAGKRRPLTPEQEEQFSQYREIMRPQGEAAVKRMMVVEALAEREGLRATEDDVDARVEELAQQHERTPGEVWLELERSGQLQVLENEIVEEKVFDYLKQQNAVS